MDNWFRVLLVGETVAERLALFCPLQKAIERENVGSKVMAATATSKTVIDVLSQHKYDIIAGAIDGCNINNVRIMQPNDDLTVWAKQVVAEAKIAFQAQREAAQARRDLYQTNQ